MKGPQFTIEACPNTMQTDAICYLATEIPHLCVKSLHGIQHMIQLYFGHNRPRYKGINIAMSGSVTIFTACHSCGLRLYRHVSIIFDHATFSKYNQQTDWLVSHFISLRMGPLSDTENCWPVRHARTEHVGISNPRWWGKRSRHSRRMRIPQFSIAGKKPMDSMSSPVRSSCLC